MPSLILFFLASILFFPSIGRADEGHDATALPSSRLGEVHFPVSCDPKVQKDFDRAVALLHSFWYDEAKRAFASVAESDPRCAMAHWGVAMTLFRPLWGMPNDAALKEGLAALEKAAVVGTESSREQGYLEALLEFYREPDSRDHRMRAVAYEKAMEALSNRFPEDKEAVIFHALALNGAALPTDQTYENQKRAGALLEPLMTEMPNHPGIAHYLIHSYDSPALAERALPAARAYAQIAPAVPHALHMPSHIFTRLGFWQESIQSNLASAAAADAHAKQTGKPSLREPQFHAMDYLAYAYLQEGRDMEVKALLDTLASIQKEIPEGAASPAYAAAAIPARYALERRRWPEAVVLIPRPSIAAPWTEGITHFARAVGAARSGKIKQAQTEVKKLTTLRDALKKQNQTYWADQVEVQRTAAEGWLAHAKGENGKAIKLMRAAADQEEGMEKHPVTPGPIVPAREMLAELYQTVRLHKDALASYEAVLAGAPNRFNALVGAARAAEKSRDPKKARTYYEKLLEVAGRSDGTRPELKEAKAFLAKAKP